jgi:NADH dehydrogenase/NADH:ubiquinone oxidoreductase subunit G
MALGASTFNDFAGAASDLFSGITGSESLQIKAQGDIAEAQSYTMAAQLAGLNEQYTKEETAVKESQNEREIYQTESQQQASVAGGGLAESGTALDLLRSSASQGALSQAIIGQQGQITEAGYQEQQESYTNMATALQQAASEEEKLASQTSLFSEITGGIKAAAGIATLFLPK